MKKNREAIREAAKKIDGEFSPAELVEMVMKSDTSLKRNSLITEIKTITVNSPSRVYYNGNLEPRGYKADLDLLLQVERNRLRIYSHSEDPKFEIVSYTDIDGRLRRKIVEVGKEEKGVAWSRDLDTTVESLPLQFEQGLDNKTFPLESALKSFLVAHLSVLNDITPGLKLFQADDEEKTSGVEFPTDVGQIDILATSPSGDFYVFELKRYKSSDAVVGQITRYMGYIKNKYGNEKINVYGVIVVGSADQKLKLATSVIPNLKLMEYSIDFKWKN